MKQQEAYIFRSKCILTISAVLLIVSVLLSAGNTIELTNNMQITSVNITQIAPVSIENIIGSASTNKKIIEVKKEEEKEDTKTEVKNLSVEEKQPVPERIWYLPTEIGIVTTYPNYGHIAYDITSPRGQGEVIYPVASGVISGIYQDYAGALIVTVRHIVNGQYYSSQYVHLSRYADIYVGEEVTPFTPLGWMGTTGISTGNHLHIALMDCNMFGNTDSCSDLNGFFQYANNRFYSGFQGLGNVIDVPGEWYSR